MRARYPVFLLLLLAAGLSGKSHGQRSLGAQLLFQLDQVTVVYPAGSGQDVALNRFSAERRAEYLEKAHGVRAEVASDGEVTGDQRKGNLLLLGWENRLLGTKTAPRPFERTPTSLRVLQSLDLDPRRDLLIFSRSPYNPEKFLTFWSRIDPALDRFMVLPRVGSEWAVYNDFLVELQGMFPPEGSWPHSIDEGATGDHRPTLRQIETKRSSKRTEHYDIFFDPGDVSEESLRRIVKSRERAFARAAAMLGPEEGRRIRLHVYGDAEKKEEYTGVIDPAHSLPERREIHMILDYALSGSPHEEIHVLAGEVLGPSYLTTVHEGLSLSEEGIYEGLPLDTHAALMLRRGDFPSLEELLDEERSRALPPKSRFPAAGMLLGWLLETTDRKLMARIYSLKNGTVKELASVLARPAPELQPAFTAWLEARAGSRQGELAALDQEARAHQRFLAGDYEGLAEALEKLLELKPDDPQTLFNLASAQMRTGEYDRAESRLLRLLELELPPSQSRFVIFSHYQLGRLYDIQGRRSAALASYRRVLELPDQHDAHRLAREAIAMPVTVENLE